MALNSEDKQKIKEIIEVEVMNDFETKRIHPYSRHEHLLNRIFWKIDNFDNA